VDRGIIFDMDGVLVDSGPAHRLSWQRIGDELGRPVTAEEFARTFGRSSRDIIRILFGEGLDDREVAHIDARKEALYRDLVRDAMPIMPGAVDLVRSLDRAGYRLAIGSSGPPDNIALVIAALGIASEIDAVVSGFDVNKGKPDPQVFVLAASKIGVATAGCVVVEDAPSGVEAAHRGGMKAIALASSHARHELAAADVIVDRLSEIDLAMIARLL
jgi:HAD superfamily hydrolase (TIGR01509 family)